MECGFLLNFNLQSNKSENAPTYYHASPVANNQELKPFLSEHGHKYVYFSTNPLVALLYSVKPVPKPFSWYTYGFNCDGILVYSEYFENQFKTIYGGKRGYLYECDNLSDLLQLSNISCAYASAKSVKVDRMTEVPDLYDYFLHKEKCGEFIVKPYSDITECERNLVIEELKNYISKYNLNYYPDNPMSIFISKYFSDYNLL